MLNGHWPAFNQEKTLVGAFSVIVQPVVEPMDRFTALVCMVCVYTELWAGLSVLWIEMLDKLPPCFLFALSSECIHHQKRGFLCNSSSIQIHTLILEPSMEIRCNNKFEGSFVKIVRQRIEISFHRINYVCSLRPWHIYSIMWTHRQYLHTLLNAGFWSMVGLSKCQVGKMTSIKHTFLFPLKYWGL